MQANDIIVIGTPAGALSALTHLSRSFTCSASNGALARAATSVI